MAYSFYPVCTARILSAFPAPEEGHIAITTHVRKGSRLKQHLMRLRSGDTIRMLGPVLNFTFSKSSKQHVFPAQGIGITPFRSMHVQAKYASLQDRAILFM